MKETQKHQRVTEEAFRDHWQTVIDTPPRCECCGKRMVLDDRWKIPKGTASFWLCPDKLCNVQRKREGK